MSPSSHTRNDKLGVPLVTIDAQSLGRLRQEQPQPRIGHRAHPREARMVGESLQLEREPVDLGLLPSPVEHLLATISLTS